VDRISEPAREGFLYQLWLERDFSRSSVKTIDGQEIVILEKGARNRDSGPDFLGALIRFRDQMLRGDVEVHPVAGDWYSHGHQLDPRYNSVILHVVTMYCPQEFRTLRQDGTCVPTLNLDSLLDLPAEQLEQDQDDSPFNESELPGCRLAGEADERKWRILEHGARNRIGLMAGQMQELRTSESWDQIIYLNLLNALGFSKNQIPFRRLAHLLPVETIWNYIWNDPPGLALEKTEAWLFGAAGLLPPVPVVNGSDVDQYVQRLQKQWDQFPERPKKDPLKPESWQFFRLRPANFPTRRIAAAAAIVVRFREKGFIPALMAPLSVTERKPRNPGREWLKAFLAERHPFWSHHYHFSPTRSPVGIVENKILGEDRSHDIVLNVVIPGLSAYADETEDGRLGNQVRSAFQEYPAVSDNETTRTMKRLIFGGQSRTVSVRRAWQQQGMLYLAKSLCRPGECRRCLEMQRA